ncbi:MAG: hypothetical protein ACYCWE_20405 [Eubacteriales bacterium]
MLKLLGEKFPSLEGQGWCRNPRRLRGGTTPPAAQMNAQRSSPPREGNGCGSCGWRGDQHCHNNKIHPCGTLCIP